MSDRTTDEKVEDAATIALTPDEAVVLFDMIARWEHDKSKPFPPDECFESPAEIVVLLNAVQKQLEEQLAAPFRADYGDHLEAARARLARGWEDFTLRI
jgi:hypothetical protein